MESGFGNSMESIWTGPWNVHGMHYSMVIPYGFHSGYGMGKWVRPQPKIFHMEDTGECKDLNIDDTGNVHVFEFLAILLVNSSQMITCGLLSIEV